MGHSRTPVAPNDATECEIAGGPRYSCADCRGHRQQVQVEGIEIARRFTSEFEGLCRNCGHLFPAGSRIGTPTDGVEQGYVCPECCDQLAGL